MKKIKIVTDSSSGITQQQAMEMGVEVLPISFIIDGECYQEDVTLSRKYFFEKLRQGAKVSTSQPTPSEIMERWDRVLLDYEQIVYIPISSGLSGSFQTASSVASMEKYQNRVFVVDNGRVSTPHRRSVMDAVEMLHEGYNAEQIKKMLEDAGRNVSIYITLDNLTYLKQGGRISTTAATVGTIINIKPVLYLETGLIESFQNCRGTKKAHKVMIQALRKDMETRFKEWYDRGEIYLLAASSASLEETKEWLEEIREAFPDLDVMCDELPMEVVCHVGPGALGIGCSCQPKRL